MMLLKKTVYDEFVRKVKAFQNIDSSELVKKYLTIINMLILPNLIS